MVLMHIVASTCISHVHVHVHVHYRFYVYTFAGDQWATAA